MDFLSASHPVRVALVNDHEIVVRGLESMLRNYSRRVEVVELAASTTVSQPVDVALYDTFSGEQADGSRIDQILSDPTVSSVAVYSWNMHLDLVTEARRKGVRGYLSKSLHADALVDALERVAAGEELVVPASEVGEGHLGIDLVAGDWPGRAEGLTARQAEVVSLITQGLSNEEIARHSHLTLNTVKTYIRVAYRRMGVTSRTQAVLWGIEHDMAPDRTRIRREPAPADTPSVAR